MKRLLKTITSPLRTHGKNGDQRLPPIALRMGGEHFAGDDGFVQGARHDVERLVELVGLSESSSVLDFGSGPGRLAIGIEDRFGSIKRYVGVDVQRQHILWSNLHLPKGYKFIHTSAQNARYNEHGRKFVPIPVEPPFTIAYAYSVFSHMRTDDCRWYLQEFARVLESGGSAFLTVFVEEGVEPDTENPAGYGPLAWSGALHCVRFEKSHFESLIKDSGLEIARFDYASDTDGQSLYILRKP